MADGHDERSEVFWSLMSWGAALLAALVVGYVVAVVFGARAPAGLIFGAVTFVVLGWVLSRLLGPPAAADVPHVAATAGHGAHAAPAAPAAAPVAEPVRARVAAPPDPQSGAISERVREAARAAGEAARAAVGEAPAPVFAGEAVRPAALAGPREGGAADDLKTIKGVGPKLEALLHELGFWHFDQIAGWSAAEIAWVDANLEGFNGRVTRDDWVGQSKVLAGGGETEFSQRVDRGEVY